eukprot:m.483467 g.483467  ORF g.483467 m.483467 type:complete len:118 (+) comp22947_c0_seq1:293-646(+)
MGFPASERRRQALEQRRECFVALFLYCFGLDTPPSRETSALLTAFAVLASLLLTLNKAAIPLVPDAPTSVLALQLATPAVAIAVLKIAGIVDARLVPTRQVAGRWWGVFTKACTNTT